MGGLFLAGRLDFTLSAFLCGKDEEKAQQTDHSKIKKAHFRSTEIIGNAIEQERNAQDEQPHDAPPCIHRNLCHVILVRNALFNKGKVHHRQCYGNGTKREELQRDLQHEACLRIFYWVDE